MIGLFIIKLLFLLAPSLTVATAKADLVAKPYRGAEIYSKERVRFGKFEVRMKTEFASGVLSTFFLYDDFSWKGDDYEWREIDVEIISKRNNQ